MAISAGTRLGPYEILTPLGKGGMGEVYRGRDTRLGRAVAIKVLAERLQNPQSRERFEREARAVASLRHQNICVLHDIGHQDDIDFLVMEYLEGETLAHRLQRGPLPLEHALRIGGEIAEALHHAHRNGVVHRDLKPGNVMLTDGGAKLLDFGLAKVHGGARGAAVTALHSVETTPLTAEGTILGTMQYMAPEQLEGKEADARSDLFAFGAVLYEMVTGQRAFQGSSPASLIAAILTAEPPHLSEWHTLSPAGLGRVVKACLMKNPEERWQAAQDLVLELHWIAHATREPALQPTRRRRPFAWIAGAAVVLALVAANVWYLRDTEVPQPVMRFTIPAPDKTSYEDFEALSPDGRRLAFIGIGPSGHVVLWIRSLDSVTAFPVPGTEGAHLPFWSPDSRFVGFFTATKMKKVPVEFGSGTTSAQTVADAPSGRGGAWSPGGDIIFARNIEDGLYRVSASGGQVTPLTLLDRAKQENSHRWPQFLPDGKRLLYLARSSRLDEQGVYVGTPGAKDWKLLLRTPVNALVAMARKSRRGAFPTSLGYIFFMREQTLLVQPFDLERLEVRGEPSAIAESVATEQNRGVFTVSLNSLLAYRTSSSKDRAAQWFEPSGKALATTAAGPGSFPRISHDGRQVVFSRVDPLTGAGDIWLEDISRHISTRLTSHPAYDWVPIWSPDGSTILFASNRNGPMDLYTKRVGGGTEEAILKSEERKVPTDWSRDGQFAFFQQEDPKTKWDVWALRLTGDRKPFPILESQFNETQACLSPDGKWLAYTSDETGSNQVYMCPFVAGSRRDGGKFPISTDGGSEPRWRRDGKELFYRGAHREIMSVAIKSGTTFEAGIPAPLFTCPGEIAQYDAMPDGSRFLIAIGSDRRSSAPVTVVLNWSATMK